MTKTSDDLEKVGRDIGDLPFSMVISDPRLEDCPIVYVNNAFERTTLYARDMALGRNCRFLQGEDTSPEDVRRIREGLERREDFSVDILNYRADGSTFRNRLLISPLLSSHDELVGFLGVQQELRDPSRAGLGKPDELREIQHRVKNHLAMIVSLIRLQSRRQITRDSFEALARRIESLSLLYDELSGRGIISRDANTVPAGAYLSRVAAVLVALGAREGIRINIDCEEVELSVEKAARLGLVLSELTTNALQHAFVGRGAGLIEIRLTKLTDGGLRLTVEDDGIGLPPDSDWPNDAPSIAEQRSRTEGETGVLDTRGRDGGSGMGGTIIRTMTESLDAQVSITSATRGTMCTLDMTM